MTVVFTHRRRVMVDKGELGLIQKLKIVFGKESWPMKPESPEAAAKRCMNTTEMHSTHQIVVVFENSVFRGTLPRLAYMVKNRHGALSSGTWHHNDYWVSV